MRVNATQLFLLPAYVASITAFDISIDRRRRLRMLPIITTLIIQIIYHRYTRLIGQIKIILFIMLMKSYIYITFSSGDWNYLEHYEHEK